MNGVSISRKPRVVSCWRTANAILERRMMLRCICGPRRSPHMCVRWRSPRKSNTTEVSISMSAGRGEFRGDFVSRQIELFARRHILEGVASGGHFVIADNQGVTRRQFVGQFHGAFQLA